MEDSAPPTTVEPAPQPDPTPAPIAAEPPAPAAVPVKTAKSVLDDVRARRSQQAEPPRAPGPHSKWDHRKKPKKGAKKPARQSIDDKRREREESFKPEGDTQPPPGEPAEPAARKAETQQERNLRERARIGKERIDWAHLINATATPLVSLVLKMTSGVELERYQVEVPVIGAEGEYGKWTGPMDSAISVVMGQGLAYGMTMEVAMERPWAIPVLSAVSLATQVLSVIALQKMGVKPEEAAAMRARAVESGATINTQPAPAPNHQ